MGDRRNGRGFYSDPLGKPSLISHWLQYAEVSVAALTLAPQRTTDEGLAAAGVPRRGASAPTWDGDGVAVRVGETRIEEQLGPCGRPPPRIACTQRVGGGVPVMLLPIVVVAIARGPSENDPTVPELLSLEQRELRVPHFFACAGVRFQVCVWFARFLSA